VTLLWLFVIVAIMVVSATLLTRSMVALMGRLAGETIQQLHAGAEYIVEHHSVPPAWQAKLGKRLRGLGIPETASGRAAAHRSRAKRACLRQLVKLIKHFQRTSLVVDEEARDILVSELVRVNEEWRSRGWEEMTTPSGGPS
jgi:uncharacterized membrane protein YcjF (UPF0283 family)